MHTEGDSDSALHHLRYSAAIPQSKRSRALVCNLYANWCCFVRVGSRISNSHAVPLRIPVNCVVALRVGARLENAASRTRTLSAALEPTCSTHPLRCTSVSPKDLKNPNAHPEPGLPNSLPRPTNCQAPFSESSFGMG
eukprot:6205076-Pleurochrysis_carterae.AAC.1